jgi:peptidoglycan-associated lipoprotein
MKLIVPAFLVAVAACAAQQPPAAEPAPRQPVAETAPAPEPEEAKADTLAGRDMELALDPATIYFDFDSDVLREDSRKELGRVADGMRDRSGARLRIEGHCDDRGTVEYNLALGERRAQNTKQYLVRLGVKDTRLSTISYGESQPAAQGDDESTWAKNRRSELVPVEGVARN